mgnify:CR=1 FL=1
MVKILNLVKAAVLFVGMVWGMYGNRDATVEGSPPKRAIEIIVQQVAEPALNQEELRKGTEYPTIDLTKVASRTRTVSAPLKTSLSEHGGLP